MAKPIIHAESSARRYGGIPEDYLEVHDLMDSSKSAFPDNRHRALTHNSWFFFIVERIFGHQLNLTCTECGHKGEFYGISGLFGIFRHCNSRGRAVAHTRDICEQHVLEDFGNRFIPTPADFLEGMEFMPWMNNATSGSPTSHRKMASHSATTRRRAIELD